MHAWGKSFTMAISLTRLYFPCVSVSKSHFQGPKTKGKHDLTPKNAVNAHLSYVGMELVLYYAATLRHVGLRHVVLFYVVFCYIVCVVPYLIMLCCIASCYVVLCCVEICCVVLCCVASCCVVPSCIL